MPNFPIRIQQILEEGYEFRFGEYISRGFQYLNRNVGLFIAFLLVYFLISIVLAVIPIIGSIGSLVISPPLTIGFYYAAHRSAQNEDVTFNDFFRGFEKFGPLVLTSLLYALIIVGAALPGLILLISGGVMGFSGGFDDTSFGGMMFGGLLLTIIPAMYFGISYMLAPLFVWFYDLEPWPAMEASRKLVNKQFFSFLGFAIVIALIGMSGILLLGVGILYTAPAIYCSIYAAFADITRLDEIESGDSDVIEHFVPGA